MKKKKDSHKGVAWNFGGKEKKILKNSAAVRCEGIQKYIIW